MAKSKRGQQFKSVLGLYGDLKTSQGTCYGVPFIDPINKFSLFSESRQRAALELLPMLIPGKKKGLQARKFFVDLNEVMISVRTG